MSKTTELVQHAVEEPIRNMGYELVDVELTKEGQSRILSIYIHKVDGVTVEDCEMVSRAIDPIIEKLDPVEDAYFLSVSSPGLDRPFKKPADYLRAVDTLVEVNLYRQVEGKKHFFGQLIGYEEGTGDVSISTEEGTYRIEKNAISRIRPWVTFE